jgi:hypothetical protein
MKGMQRKIELSSVTSSNLKNTKDGCSRSTGDQWRGRDLGIREGFLSSISDLWASFDKANDISCFYQQTKSHKDG